MIEAGAFTIQLAGKRIHIRPLYDMVREYCKAYIVPDACADLSVQILAEDIAYEREGSLSGKRSWQVRRKQHIQMLTWKHLPYTAGSQNGCQCRIPCCFMARQLQ